MPLSGDYARSGGAWRRSIRTADTLPQSGAEAIFTVTGTVIAFAIEGEVTTAFQAQANNMKLTANPTVGADTDICAVADVTGNAVGTHLSITGTFATALVESANGAHVAQAAGVVLTAGTLDLSCSASSTGGAKWTVLWQPLTADGNMTPTAI